MAMNSQRLGAEQVHRQFEVVQLVAHWSCHSVKMPTLESWQRPLTEIRSSPCHDLWESTPILQVTATSLQLASEGNLKTFGLQQHRTQVHAWRGAGDSGNDFTGIQLGG